MKKLMIMTALVAFAGSASAGYVNFIPAGAGSIYSAGNWPGGVFPSGSTTGVVTAANTSSWIGGGVMQDFALRQTGGYVNGINAVYLRGGSSGSGITTVYEIETTDYATVNNFSTGTLGMWSQHGEKMEFSIVAGQVQVGALNLNSNGKGTINMGEGIIHSLGLVDAKAQINFLAGTSGDIVIDAMDDLDVSALYIDFASDNTGSMTIGSVTNGSSAYSKLSWMIGNGRVSIDKVANTDLASYNLGTAGISTTLSVIPEPATLGLVAAFGGTILFIRRRFMI
jgi:hypothetical protein